MTRPPAPPVGGEWAKIGTACVDSGSLAIIDPCYVIERGEEIYGWNDFNNLYEGYCEDLGVQFWAGYGDGVYEVWAYVINEPGDCNRVAQVTVCLIDGEL